MERFKINCEIANKPVELQFDIKKMPGETGPCYMVSVDGLFKGYIKKEKSGKFGQLMNSNFDERDMLVINAQLSKLNKEI
jgi:hypothetical protein